MSATQRLRHDGRTWIGTTVVVLLVLLAIAAPLMTMHDPARIDLRHTLEAPSTTHWLGTDAQGRDVWSRLVYGARVSLLVGITSQGIALAIGVGLGLIAGYRGDGPTRPSCGSPMYARVSQSAAAHAMAAAFEPRSRWCAW